MPLRLPDGWQAQLVAEVKRRDAELLLTCSQKDPLLMFNPPYNWERECHAALHDALCAVPSPEAVSSHRSREALAQWVAMCTF